MVHFLHENNSGWNSSISKLYWNHSDNTLSTIFGMCIQFYSESFIGSKHFGFSEKIDKIDNESEWIINKKYISDGLLIHMNSKKYLEKRMTY